MGKLVQVRWYQLKEINTVSYFYTDANQAIKFSIQNAFFHRKPVTFAHEYAIQVGFVFFCIMVIQLKSPTLRVYNLLLPYRQQLLNRYWGSELSLIAL